MGVMRIIDSTGDTMLEWSPTDVVAVNHAEQVFNDMRSRRQLAFARSAGCAAEDVERIFAFDATAEEIIWVRPIAGG